MAGTVFLFASDRIGDGDEALGSLLVRTALKTAAKLSPPLETVILLNRGVMLACKGSPVVEELEALVAQGTKVLSCGTCLDFYRLKESVAVGTVSNMLEILTTAAGADHLVRL